MSIGPTLGSYNIVSRLSVGGMGEVYLAEDTKLHRKVALKVLPPEWGSDPERLERFQWEAQVLATLNHPNIVTIYSVEKDEDIHFFTMELVEGKTLGETIPVGGLPLDRFLEIAVPLADALATAHERGIIHRDMKPGNVMVRPDGRVKVLDFGLAKREPTDPKAEPEPEETKEPALSEEALRKEPQTQDGRLLGTVAYMAPEQMAGLEIDHRADIFTLGVVYYEMLTGVRPFAGSNWAEMISDHLTERPTAVAPLEARLPERLEEIIQRCLEKDPEVRYQTAVELRENLNDLQLEVVSGSYSSTQIVRPEIRRPRPWKAAAGAAALFLAAALVGWWSLGPGEDGVAVTGGTEAEEKRIVVLPFENLGPPEDEYFAEGITEEITSRLASASALKVISRTTARRYDRAQRTGKEIGAELGVDYLLEGTVRWSPGEDGKSRVRVTPQLVQVADDTHLWSARYERVIDDIFAVQSEIAEEVIRQLGIVLLEPERHILTAAPPTENLDAYEAYLRGMDYATRLDPKTDNWRLAVSMFERAVRLDPSFALAYAELSRAHSFLYKQSVNPNESRLAAALAAAEKALNLDPERGDGHRALGYYYYWGHGDYTLALQEFAIAAERLPNDSALLEGIGYIRRRQGLFDDALERFQEAFELNPRSSWLAAELAHTYTNLRRYKLAERYYDYSIAAAPDQPHPYELKAMNALRWTGDTEKARTILLEMPQQAETSTLFTRFQVELMARNHSGALAQIRSAKSDLIGIESALFPKDLLLAFGYRQMGDAEQARNHYEKAVRRLEQRLEGRDENPRVFSALGLAYAGLGRKDEAIRLGRRAVELYPVTRDAFVGPEYVEHLSVIYAVTGEAEAAVDQLDYVLSIPSGVSRALLRISPRWDSLRGHPRFERLIAEEM